MEFKELPWCLGFVHTTRTKQNRTDVGTQRRKFLPDSTEFSLSDPRRPEKDNRVRSYRCSFQGSLSRKRADKQRHKVRVYLRPVCKATRLRDTVRNETIRGERYRTIFPLTFAADTTRTGIVRIQMEFPTGLCSIWDNKCDTYSWLLSMLPPFLLQETYNVSKFSEFSAFIIVACCLPRLCLKCCEY